MVPKKKTTRLIRGIVDSETSKVNPSSLKNEIPIILGLVIDDQNTESFKLKPLRDIELMNYDHNQGKLTVFESLPGFLKNVWDVDFDFRDLLCLSEGIGQRCLVNPLRREVLKLPKTDKTDDCWFYGMGYDDISKRYKIIGISAVPRSIKDPRRKAKVLVLGTNSWQNVKSDGIPKFFHKCDIFQEKGVCAYEEAHWLFRKSRGSGRKRIYLLSFNFKKGEFYWSTLPFNSYYTAEVPDLYLITWKETIAIVDNRLPAKMEIWVMNDAKKWESRYNLNMQMLEENDTWFQYCMEWEKGLVFSRYKSDTSLFVDLESDSVRIVTCPKKYYRILSLKRSLISLKDVKSKKRSREPLMEDSGSKRQGQSSCAGSLRPSKKRKLKGTSDVENMPTNSSKKRSRGKTGSKD